MIQDRNRIYDGYFSLEGGVDGGRRPNLIEKNRCSRFDNGVFRGGAPSTRPPLLTLALTFENPNLYYNGVGAFVSEDTPGGNSATNFRLGRLQEASYFSPGKDQEYIMAMIAGRLYQITPGLTSVSIREIILAQRNRRTLTLAWMVQADAYHITQDGESQPIIFDGVNARRPTAGEIFTGTVMGYGQDRIILVGTDQQIYFGDIRNGKGNGGVDVLGFTENSFLAEGFPSALPSEMGNPTAIAFLPQQDAATGVGDCLVFGESGAEAFTISIPREEWKNSQFQREALRKIGCTGHRQIAEINNDIWFRSTDGWRSYRQARAEIDKWGQIPLSTPVKYWLDNDTPSLLNYGSAISFDNRLIATCTPQPNQLRPFHNGLLSIDFDVISSFAGALTPAWDGHWTHRALNALKGLRVSQLIEGHFAGRKRAFAFVIDPSGYNAIVEIQPELSGQDTAGPITAQLVTRSMDNDAPDNEKGVYGGDLWVDEVAEPVTITAEYKPDQVPDFQPWDAFTVGPQGVPGAITPGGVPTMTLGYSPRRSLQKPSDNTDPVTQRIYRRGYEIQARLTWAGRATLRRFRMQMQEQLEDAKAKV